MTVSLADCRGGGGWPEVAGKNASCADWVTRAHVRPELLLTWRVAAFTGRAHVRPIFFPSNITRSVAKITGLLKTRKNPVATSIGDDVPRKSKNTVRYRVIVELFTAVQSLEVKLHETINIGVEIVRASKRIRFCRMVMHRTVAVAASLEDELVKMLHQPLYSPNLEPCDYLFFVSAA